MTFVQNTTLLKMSMTPVVSKTVQVCESLVSPTFYAQLCFLFIYWICKFHLWSGFLSDQSMMHYLRGEKIIVCWNPMQVFVIWKQTPWSRTWKLFFLCNLFNELIKATVTVPNFKSFKSKKQGTVHDLVCSEVEYFDIILRKIGPQL